MYNKIYDDKRIRGKNEHFVSFVEPFLHEEMDMVDLGCGSCRKVAKFAKKVKRIDAIDRSKPMLKQAQKRLHAENITNVRLFDGDNINTPFRSQQFDICTTALSTWSVPEAYRLLKAQGLFFIETLCPDDKFQIKQAFGEDEMGWRGYLYNQTSEERMEQLKKSLEPFFEIEDVQFVETQTTLSKKGFIRLLKVTPTIRGFSLKKDKPIIEKLENDGKIAFTEKRVMIRAKRK